VDRVSANTRSRIMSKVRCRGNRSTELRVRLMLVRSGLSGWTVQPSGIFGRPDFAFKKERIAIFVDSCFWHGCKDHCRMPASNADYWNSKIDRNRKRDRLCCKVLKSEGWRVLRLWEHEIETSSRMIKRVQALLKRQRITECNGPTFRNPSAKRRA
jgi:DNA mismatch endonuclease (patch repair protein)